VAIADNFPANTTAIISGAIAALSNNPKRRFVYVEQAFFTVFFEEADAATQAAARALVASKQLTFLNGGWCMPDEASPTFVDLLDNVALGHRNIVKNFNVAALPSFGSQLDPFGHSAFMGVLTSPAGGYTGLTWARESADFKMACCKARALERVWTPSPSLGPAKATTFQAIFNDAGYGTPDEVGRCDYNFNITTCNATWAPKDFAALKSDIEEFRFPNFLSNEVLLNFGDDFVYKGEAAFAYVDALIDLLNADPSKRYNAFYSTAEDYAAATMASVSLPKFGGDYMPYNDDSGGGMRECRASTSFAGAPSLGARSPAPRVAPAAPLTPASQPFMCPQTTRGQAILRRVPPSRALCASRRRTTRRRGSCRRSRAASSTRAPPTRCTRSSAPWA